MFARVGRIAISPYRRLEDGTARKKRVIAVGW
jgi:hypothetical protein